MVNLFLKKILSSIYSRWILNFSNGKVKFKGRSIKVTDTNTFIQLKVEIFDRCIYKFTSTKTAPVIIDCGANIGMGVIYFKSIFPSAHIHAFEPDKKNYEALSYNVKSLNLSDVEIYNEAVWIEDGLISFEEKCTVASRIVDSESGTKVKSIQLKKFLEKFDFIDLLKIDIEGAENLVIEDIRQELNKVNYLFVEYHSAQNENQKLDKILAVLNECKFRYYIDDVFSDSYKLNKVPFIDRNTNNGFDLQLNIYAYR